MKIFFGDALEDMVRELRAQAAPTVRVHVLSKVEGQSLLLSGHVTTFASNMIYESVIENRVSLAGVRPEKLQGFIKENCEEHYQNVAQRLKGFEIRRGILQE